jgi:hypothetical protein
MRPGEISHRDPEGSVETDGETGGLTVLDTASSLSICAGFQTERQTVASIDVGFAVETLTRDASAAPLR